MLKKLLIPENNIDKYLSRKLRNRPVLLGLIEKLKSFRATGNGPCCGAI